MVEGGGLWVHGVVDRRRRQGWKDLCEHQYAVSRGFSDRAVFVSGQQSLAVASPAMCNGSLHTTGARTSNAKEIRNAIWYTTLRENATSNSAFDVSISLLPPGSSTP